MNRARESTLTSTLSAGPEGVAMNLEADGPKLMMITRMAAANTQRGISRVRLRHGRTLARYVAGLAVFVILFLFARRISQQQSAVGSRHGEPPPTTLSGGRDRAWLREVEPCRSATAPANS
jgi:hypothetical protein